jgi:mono/diheme cytochrome c family protein
MWSWRTALLLACLIAGNTGAAPVVLSVDRLYRSDTADLVEAGEILLTELHCVNCHAADGELAKRIPSAPGPAVHNSFTRLQPGYLEKWLTNPHATKAGVRMPDVLANLPVAERAPSAKALAEFIKTLPGDQVTLPTLIPAGNLDRGRELFHSIGCIACHQPRADFKKAASGEAVDPLEVNSLSLPLGKLGDKYTWRGLLGFLETPHADRPSGRMPRIPMTNDERVDLTWYLLGGKTPAKAKNATGQLRLVRQGRQLFGSLGCAACHNTKDEQGTINSTLKATPLAKLKPSGGCLSGTGKSPRFGLDAFQRKALTAALSGLTKRSGLTAAHTTHRRMVSLNCYACHTRNQIGGPDDERLKYFVSSGSDLGDEGRVPPILTGAGRKMQHGAIEQVIQGRMPARPYMVTRMPDFGEAHAKHLAAGFAKADFDPNEKPTARDGEEFQVGRNMWGRALLGIKGLSCITCHRLNGKKSLGIQSMDLAHSAKRLRPAWFRDYVIDPAKFRPGTRMPSFWPKGKPMLKGNGGSTARQIDSVWVYLNELDQSRMPVGLEKTGDFLLKPAEKPIVFRTFMERVGMHAVAVGYPAATHAAFDSQSPRWAMAWTGKFLDAESTWDDRFTPLAKPEGSNLIAIQPSQPVHDRNNVAQFEGYKLHLRTGHPIFHYKVGGESFTDVMLPDSGGGKRMTRTLAKKSGKQAKWIEIANGKTITKSGQDWTVDKKLKVSTRDQTRVVTTAKGNHLQVNVAGTSTVIYEW